MSVQSFLGRLLIAEAVMQGKVEVSDIETLSVEYVYYY